jgi:hypothetical protein
MEEAEQTLEQLSADIFGSLEFDEFVWESADSCATAPFSPEQGDIGRALIRSYAPDAVDSIGASPDSLQNDFDRFWNDRGEVVSPASPDSPRGSVARANGIGYDILVDNDPVQLRAFTPCY